MGRQADMEVVRASTQRDPRRMVGRLIVVACLAVAAPSTAYPKTMQEKMQAACADDVARLCPETGNDSDGLKPCMLKHRKDVSPSCMRFIDASE